jgi:protein kinase/serine/threonine-protein kinase
VAIDDPDNYVSAVQVQFDTDGNGNWLLRDRSLNGTWVQRGDGWQRVLSERGRDRLGERADESAAELAALPEEITLADGDRIALVHPSYDVWLAFDAEGGR